MNSLTGARWLYVAVLAASGLPLGKAAIAQANGAEAGQDAANLMVGRATILRGFYGGSELAYDTLGSAEGQPKVVDWTLAGADVQKVTTGSDGAIELDGVRVAIRYNPEQHTFERHPLKDTRIRIKLAGVDDTAGIKTALVAIFSVGIDPSLQRSMPTYWRHYFRPGLDWGADELAGQTILPLTVKPGEGVNYPVLEKKSEPEYTQEAARDKVKGTVQLKIVVGADGVPHRIAIRQPLGYGLDERAVAAVSKWRFRPGSKDGKAAAFELLVNQTFDVASGPAR